MTATEMHAQQAEDAATAEESVEDLAKQLLDECDPKTNDSATFLGAQFDKGLAWVHFPVGHGGLGVNPKLQKIVNERIVRRGRTKCRYYRNPIGYGMCGPTVVVWGSEEQKKRYLRPLFTGEEIWCQLFSEPGCRHPTSPACRRRAFATATSGSSTARRCGPRWPTCRAGVCWSCAPTPRP